MQNAAKTSRFLIDFSSEREFTKAQRHTKLGQQTVVRELTRVENSGQVFNELSKRLIQLAEHSFSLRDIDKLEEASLILVNLPITRAYQIGGYYQALALSRIGKTEQAQSQLEGVAESAPLRYRARALQTLGSIYHRQGSHDEALRLYTEATQASSPKNAHDFLTTLLVNFDVSCIKSETGDHEGALADYEKLSPLVQIVARQNPLYFYLYHNELAIEFAELGRFVEAEAASAIAIASPFAHAYPEWSATRDEIAAKRKSASPSVVAIHQVSEAEPTAKADQAAEADREIKAELHRKPGPSKPVAFISPSSNKDFFQRSTITVPSRTTIALNAVNILDRMSICVGPRAPPALS